MEESLLAPLTTDSTSMLQESQFRTVGSGKTRMRKTANCFDSCDKSLSVDVEKKNTCSSSAQDLEYRDITVENGDSNSTNDRNDIPNLDARKEETSYSPNSSVTLPSSPSPPLDVSLPDSDALAREKRRLMISSHVHFQPLSSGARKRRAIESHDQDIRDKPEISPRQPPRSEPKARKCRNSQAKKRTSSPDSRSESHPSTVSTVMLAAQPQSQPPSPSLSSSAFLSQDAQDDGASMRGPHRRPNVPDALDLSDIPLDIEPLPSRRANGKSKYRGVTQVANGNWKAQITLTRGKNVGKSRYLGHFSSEREAGVHLDHFLTSSDGIRHRRRRRAKTRRVLDPRIHEFHLASDWGSMIHLGP